MNPMLVTMSGPNNFDVRNLSNFEAGIAFLTLVNKLSPGITFGKLARSMDAAGAGFLAGWSIPGLSSITKAIGDLKDGIGDVLKDTWDTVGGSAGDAVRLVTDEKVIDGASRLGTAYATNGGSEGVRSVLDGLTGGGEGGGNAVDKVMAFISALGSSFKGQVTAPNQAGMFSGAALPWLIGGGLVLFLVTGRRK